MSEFWTPEKVRETLPYVSVRINGRNVIGRVSGRKNRFASVSLGYSTALQQFVDRTYSWEAVARSLNTGEPLH